MIDLKTAIFDYIEEKGTKDAAKFFGKNETVLKKWMTGSAFPDVMAAQKILEELFKKGEFVPPEPAPVQGKTKLDEIVPPDQVTRIELGDTTQKMGPPELKKGQRGSNTFALAMPTHREIAPHVMLSVLGNWKATLPEEIRAMLAGMDLEYDTLIHRARNILATRFLEENTAAEWLFWMDSDVIAPIGNPGWFRRRTNAKWADDFLRRPALRQLTCHPDKTIVAAVYSQRNPGGRVIAQPGFSDSAEAKALHAEILGKGPQNKIVAVPWVGFGCVATHRSVFVSILEKFPELKSPNPKERPHRFFDAIENGPTGEDVAFCRRAGEAGHQSYLDLSVFCAHIGKFAYLPH